MLQRASWFVRLGLLACIMSSSVQAETITISFDDLYDYAQSKGPRSRIIHQELDRVLAERDEALQWSNPEFAYVREDAGPAAEYQLTVGKRIEAPWANRKKRSSWKDRVSSAELAKEQSISDHFAALRSGYVGLRLFDEYLLRLGQLREILTDASHVATTRHTEGHLSGVEEHLIQMSVISLNASHQSVLQEREELSASWRALMGLNADDTVGLVTGVSYGSIDIRPAEHYIASIKSQPGYTSRRLLASSLNKLASAERGKFIPTINLYAGLKKIEPDYNGYVAGVSLSLPVFNRNGATARRYQIESKIAQSRLRLYNSRATGQVRALTELIKEARQALASASPHFEEDSQDINSLLYSYEEGWLTLNELLTAIQIEVTGSKGYYDQLIQFYQNLFQLETITGESLVSFEE